MNKWPIKELQKLYKQGFLDGFDAAYPLDSTELTHKSKENHLNFWLTENLKNIHFKENLEK